MAIVKHMTEGWSAYYKLDHIEALVSAAIIEDKRTSNLTTEKTREEYRKKVIVCSSGLFAGIGDLVVTLPRPKN